MLTAPRTGLVSANKEGITSLPGYISLFLFGVDAGLYALPPEPFWAYRPAGKRFPAEEPPRVRKTLTVMATTAVGWWLALGALSLFGTSASTQVSRVLVRLLIRKRTKSPDWLSNNFLAGESSLYLMGLCPEHLHPVDVLARTGSLDTALAGSTSLGAGTANVRCGEQERSFGIPSGKPSSSKRICKVADLWRVAGEPPHRNCQPQHEHAHSIKLPWLLCRYRLHALCFGSSMALPEHASSAVGPSQCPLLHRYPIVARRTVFDSAILHLSSSFV